MSRLIILTNIFQISDPDCVIIYCTEKKQTQILATVLKDEFHFAADFYHSEVGEKRKKANMDKFQRNEITIMCSTTAFGMGIDKPNVRAVIHFAMSYSLTNYYQESSRAGRDNKPAYCILFHHVSDVAIVRTVFLHGKSGAQLNVAREQLRSMTAYCWEARRCRQLMIEQCVLHVPLKSENCFEHMDTDILPEDHGATCCDNCLLRERDKKISLPLVNIRACILEQKAERDNFQRRFAMKAVVKILKKQRRKYAKLNIEDQVLAALVDMEILVRGRRKMFSIGKTHLFDSQI